MQADHTSLEQAAALLLAAENPLIVTKYLGRNPEAVAHLAELAELLSIPVVQQPDYMNFSTDHSLYLAYHTVRHAKKAHVLFFIMIDVPSEPPNRIVLRSDVKIIHLERDPLFTAVPGWSFPADLAMTGCSEITLPLLNSMVKAKLSARVDMKAKL